MIFNPLFLNETGNNQTLVSKPGKLSKNKYLFSDIVKVVMNPTEEEKKITDINIDGLFDGNLQQTLSTEQEPVKLKSKILTESDNEQVKSDLADILPEDIAHILINDEIIVNDEKIVSYLGKEPLQGELQNFLNGLVGKEILEQNINKESGLLLSLEDQKSAVNIELVEGKKNKVEKGKIIVQTLIVPEKAKLYSLFKNNDNPLTSFKANNKENFVSLHDLSNNKLNSIEKTNIKNKPTLTVYSFKNGSEEIESLTNVIKLNSNNNSKLSLLNNINDNEVNNKINKVPLEKISFTPNESKTKKSNLTNVTLNKNGETKTGEAVLKIIDAKSDYKDKDFSVRKITIVKKNEKPGGLNIEKILASQKNGKIELTRFDFKNEVAEKSSQLNILKNNKNIKIVNLENTVEQKPKEHSLIDKDIKGIKLKNEKTITPKNILKPKFVDSKNMLKVNTENTLANVKEGGVETNNNIQKIKATNIRTNKIKANNIKINNVKVSTAENTVKLTPDETKNVLKVDAEKTKANVKESGDVINKKIKVTNVNNEKVAKTENVTAQNKLETKKTFKVDQANVKVSVDKNNTEKVNINTKQVNKNAKIESTVEISEEIKKPQILTENKEVKTNNLTKEFIPKGKVDINDKIINNQNDLIKKETNTKNIETNTKNSEINDLSIKPKIEAGKFTETTKTSIEKLQNEIEVLSKKLEDLSNPLKNENSGKIISQLNSKIKVSAEKAEQIKVEDLQKPNEKVSSEENKTITNLIENENKLNRALSDLENLIKSKPLKKDSATNIENIKSNEHLSQAINVEAQQINNNKKLSVKVKREVKTVNQKNNSNNDVKKEQAAKESSSSTSQNNSDGESLNDGLKTLINPNSSLELKPNNENVFQQMLNKEEVIKLDSNINKTQEAEQKSGQRLVKSIEVIKEISQFISKQQKGSLSFDINPENLGKMKITLDIVDHALKATIEVDNELSKQLIEKNLSKLHEQLSENGVQINSLDISLANSKQQKEKADMENKKSDQAEDFSEEDIEDKEKSKSLGYNTYEYIA